MNKPFITTYSGAKFYPDDMNISDIPIEDIAHALAHNCRYNGHVERFYSVAEHCVAVGLCVPEEDRFAGLMHDVCEAFMPDMPRPLKGCIPGFDEFEERLEKAVADAFEIPWPLPESVRYVDKNIVKDEALVLYKSPPEWIQQFQSVAKDVAFLGLSPIQAKEYWLGAYDKWKP